LIPALVTASDSGNPALAIEGDPILAVAFASIAKIVGNTVGLTKHG